MRDETSKPRLEDTGRGFCVYYGDRALYSRVAPRESAQKAAQAVELPSHCLVLVFSPLLGYGLDELERRLPESSRILLLESDKQLFEFSHEALSPDRQLLFCPDHFSLHAILEKNENCRFRQTVSITLNGACTLSDPKIINFSESTRIAIRQFWRNRSTSLFMADLWIRNILKNLQNPDPREFPTHEFSGKLIFLAGAGDSLLAGLQWLKDNHNKVLLFCVDTALPTVIQSGFIPDLVIVLEAQSHNLKDFIGTPQDLPALCDLSSHPSSRRRLRSRTFFTAFSPLVFLENIEQKCRLTECPPMGNIGNTALYLTKKFSSCGILIAGLDFMSIPGAPHVRGAYSMTDHLCRSNRLSSPYQGLFAAKRNYRRVSDNGPYFTDTVMESYLPAFFSLLSNTLFYDFNPRSFFASQPGFTDPEVLFEKTFTDTIFMVEPLDCESLDFIKSYKRELLEIHQICLDFLLHGKEIPDQTAQLIRNHDELTVALGDPLDSEKKGRDYYSRLAVATSRFLQCIA